MPKSPIKNKKKQEAQHRLKPLSIIRLVPNGATIVALCIGLSSIRFALMGRYEFAVLAILMAGIFDALDGRLARLLRVESDFGAELDSLSDFVSFGVAPAVVVYIVSLEQWRGIGWAFSLMFAVCMALRLARFNIQSRLDDDDSPLPAGYFMGVPAPAAAWIACLPLIVGFALELESPLPALFHSVFILAGAILMVSRVPTFSLKTARVPRKMVGFALLLFGVFITALINALWETLALIGFAYLCTIPVSFLWVRRTKINGPDKREIAHEPST